MHRSFIYTLISTITVLVTSIFIKVFFPESTVSKELTSLLFFWILLVSIATIFVVIQWKKKMEDERDAFEAELSLAESKLHDAWDQKQKSEFVSLASHQLRSPLTAIKGYASMILEGSFGGVPIGVQEAVGRILKASTSLANTVEDFLNVSRIEEGRMEYSMGEFDIEHLIESIIKEQMYVAKERGTTVTFIKSEESCTIIGDSNKIKQVMSNIIDNAIKYTLKGKVTVSLKRDNIKRTVHISISDTGIGLTRQDIAKLFTKYNRAAGAREVNVMGTGLGLYVAHFFIEAHSGRIWATSEGEGKGSTFHIEIPLDASERATLKTS